MYISIYECVMTWKPCYDKANLAKEEDVSLEAPRVTGVCKINAHVDKINNGS